MARSRLAYLLFIPLAFLLMGARGAPLLDPDPINVPAGLTAQDVSKAIRTGIATRGWVPNKDEHGQIDAVLNLRDHTARIAINYDTKLVKVTYVSSDNLDYSEKNGARYIHRNYNNWIHNVVGDISRQLQVASVK